MEIKVGSVTGTTSNNGTLYAEDVSMNSITVLSSWASANCCAMPFISSTGNLGFRVTSTSSGNWVVVANQTRTVWYTYIDKPLPSYET